MDSKNQSVLDHLRQDPGWQAARVLDVRSEEDFEQAHLRGAVSIPLESQLSRLDTDGGLETALPSIFLPPRHEPLLLVGQNARSLARIADQVSARGRDHVTTLVLDTSTLQRLEPKYWASGRSTNHLWSAPPFLVQHQALLPPPAAGPVLDLACGSGRAIVWMALQGYQPTGIDWQPEALSLGRQLADSCGVQGVFQQKDLRIPQSWPSSRWSVVLNFRYLQRDMLSKMGNLVLPGGVAVIRTFRNAPGYTGHPHVRHRLEPGELLKFFPVGLWDILVHEENHDADGRPAAGIIARLK